MPIQTFIKLTWVFGTHKIYVHSVNSLHAFDAITEIYKEKFGLEIETQSVICYEYEIRWSSMFWILLDWKYLLNNFVFFIRQLFVK